MDSKENGSKEKVIVVLSVISKLIHNIEKKVLLNNKTAKECEELILLKEKCCSCNTLVSLSALHGINYLVERKILTASQTISMLVSLLPSVKQCGTLVPTVGNILLIDLQIQISENGKYKSTYTMQFEHPFIIILKYNLEKSWCEIYHFVLHLMQVNKNIELKHKIEFLRPVFRHVFWCSSWRGSQFQFKMFDALMKEFHEKEVMNFALEILLWQELDIHYCLFLQEFFIRLLKENHDDVKSVASGLSPVLAEASKWLIVNGYNPSLWLKILGDSVKIDTSSGSAVLFILTDVIMETPSTYINALIDVCKSIIFSTYCSKYAVYKFIAVILNWFVNPSFLANPVYKTLEEVLDFIIGEVHEWRDLTFKLDGNEYYKVFGSSKTEVKFAVDLILVCNSWGEEKTLIVNWLKNLLSSDEHRMQLRVHSLIQGILLCENDSTIINLCLDILFRLINRHKEISFSVLCLLFYKLGREADPRMQMTYLFSLPKLTVEKENIPLIVGIIESLKRGSQKIMTPFVIQLYLSLWKFDNRTYSYLHKTLHDSISSDYAWEVNVSKAIALKEICRLAPHLHAKDLVGILSKILNECSGSVSGLPSAMAIEAVTELCKAYVIDVAGTWKAIQPKLCIDRRPEVIISLCRFFGEIPHLNSSEERSDNLTVEIVPMLWNYTFFKDAEIVKSAFRALSNFPIEDLPIKLFPEIYRLNLKLPKDLSKTLKNPEEILNLPFVPAECWIQFLGKIDDEVLQDGGELLTVLIERELLSLPRSVFSISPEKSEPLHYSYLPSRSICRSLVESLQKWSREKPSSDPGYLKEAIRVLSHQYSKLLPPINWGFLENYMCLGSKFLTHCLALLAKQGSISNSAKSVLKSYFGSVVWDSDKVDEILFIYKLIPLLCKSVSYNILESFLEQTIELCLQISLDKNGHYFETVLENLTEALKNESVHSSHKVLIAKQLKKVLILIPPEKEIMKKYAMCVTEFPPKLISEITSVEKLSDIDSDWLRRTLSIGCTIMMRSETKNPLLWLKELTETVAHFPDEHSFFLSVIWIVIRSRRTCDHSTGIQEMILRIQTSITTANTCDSNKVTLFLVDVYIATVIILSGYDCLFVDAEELTANESKKLEMFPQALCVLLSLPLWSDKLSKVGLWLQELSKWKHLPPNRVKAFVRALLTLREMKSFRDENEFSIPFEMFSLNFV